MMRVMGLRIKLARQARPFLAQDEHVQAVFRAHSGSCICHLVVVTDRAIVVLDLSMWTYRPTRLRMRHPRNVYFGCLGSFTLGGRTYGVACRSRGEVAAADAALADMLTRHQFDDVTRVSHHGAKMKTLPPPGWYPDPVGAAGMRQWDGAQWGRRGP
jgi:Protein of unknown function (DUF2510)